MYGTVEKILFLRGTELFAGLCSEDLAPLARAAETVTYGPGEVIFVEGSESEELYVLVAGKVRIEVAGETLTTLVPPEAMGELALLDRGPRSATARAVDQAVLLCVGAEAFFEILHEQSQIADALLRQLSARLRAANTRLIEISRNKTVTSPPVDPT